MLAKAKRILKIGILLGIMLFVCTQVLNIRSPITIETAKACDGSVRVYGHAYETVWAPWQPPHNEPLGNVEVKLKKPDGTWISTSTNSSGYFEFTGTPETLPDGDYKMSASKHWYKSVSKSFSMGPDEGAEATIIMVPWYGHGGSQIFIVPFCPWY